MDKKTIKDPVCGTEVRAKDVVNRSDHRGHTYYFCSAVCKSQFDASPGQFAKKVA